MPYYSRKSINPTNGFPLTFHARLSRETSKVRVISWETSLSDSQNYRSQTQSPFVIALEIPAFVYKTYIIAQLLLSFRRIFSPHLVSQSTFVVATDEKRTIYSLECSLSAAKKAGPRTMDTSLAPYLFVSFLSLSHYCLTDLGNCLPLHASRKTRAILFTKQRRRL